MLKSTCNTGAGSTLGQEDLQENGIPFLYLRLENSMDREAVQAAVHGVWESDLE